MKTIPNPKSTASLTYPIPGSSEHHKLAAEMQAEWTKWEERMFPDGISELSEKDKAFMKDPFGYIFGKDNRSH